jgi:hypothetical protein
LFTYMDQGQGAVNMESTLKKSFYYLGIVAALYIFFYYVLPVIFKIIGIAFNVIMLAGIVFIVVMIAAFFIKIFRERF